MGGVWEGVGGVWEGVGVVWDGVRVVWYGVGEGGRVCMCDRGGGGV